MTFTKYIGEMQREWDRDTTRKTVMIEIDCEDIDLSRSGLRPRSRFVRHRQLPDIPEKALRLAPQP